MRPHIEHIQAQCLAWRPGVLDSLRPGLFAKVLSQGSEPSDGLTALVAYPAGYAFEGRHHLACDEEFYVVDGDLSIDDTGYLADTYGFFPAGLKRRRMASAGGAVVLTFLSGDPRRREGWPEAGAFDTGGYVLLTDLHDIPWDRQLHDPNLAGLGLARKNLRLDPRTGERTFLFMTSPQAGPRTIAGPQESHPVVEEAFLLAGDLVGPTGTLHAGAYFWRPPGIAHGPYGSRFGSLSLIRFVGGRHVNAWGPQVLTLPADPPYRPVLPPELAFLAASPWTPPQRY